MGIVINPRGASGAGKTTLARRILADYGWAAGGTVEPLYGPGRARPIAYRLGHPLGRRPLVVLGHYERTSGGCDTIRLDDGGLAEAFRLAAEFAGSGHDVLLEGAALNAEHRRSAALAGSHGLHVLYLDTGIERCVANLILRRRLGRGAAAALRPSVEAQCAAIEAACDRLRPGATVERLDFAAAVGRVRDLLGVGSERNGPADRSGGSLTAPCGRSG